jgi:hypothetical protein
MLRQNIKWQKDKLRPTKQNTTQTAEYLVTRTPQKHEHVLYEKIKLVKKKETST